MTRVAVTGRSLRARYDQGVAAEFAAQPLKRGAAHLVAGDLTGLPDPVRRYVERSGAVGCPGALLGLGDRPSGVEQEAVRV